MAKRGYVPPMDVTAPRRRWTLVEVLVDFGEREAVLALGRWEGSPVLAVRWNGDSERPIGNPQSRGMATWFILPEHFYRGILGSVPREDRERALKYLGDRAGR